MKQLSIKNSEWLVRTTLCVGAGRLPSDWTWRLRGWRKIDSHGLFSWISPTVGAFSTSRSNLELDESVEDPVAADACSILLSDSLLWTVLKSPPFYTCKATYPDRTIYPFIIINNYYTV